MKQTKKRPINTTRIKKTSHRFGGRATASGVRYEARVAAFIAVKMLSGNQCSVWDGIDGASISAVTMQAPEPVDDIVVSLRDEDNASIFISAKKRSKSIALSSKNAAFTETIAAFVKQFHKLSAEARTKSRLVWAIPSSASRSAGHYLPIALEIHRREEGDDALRDFLRRRQRDEKEALEALLSEVKREWKKVTRKTPLPEELRAFLRQVYVEVYDFEVGNHHEREAERIIRSHIVENSTEANGVWQKVGGFFDDANERGVRVTPAMLRRELTSKGVALKSPPQYGKDLAYLRDLTSQNLTRLEDHNSLRFGPQPSDAVHIERNEDLSALISAAKAGHLLITGEPGSGKSGMVHSLVKALQRDDCPVVLLLAEEIYGRDRKGSANLPDLEHSLDEILANWPNGAFGLLITDALDAVRDVETQRMLRHLLREVQKGRAGWSVIASVREFDLKYGRELREEFPGAGVPGHASKDFPEVSHFHLMGFSETQLEALAAGREGIRAFIESARNSPKSGGIHRSPFYLRLAAELLRDGVAPSRLADWNSPAVLLRKFWDTRLHLGSEAADRENALKTICRQMVDNRNMTMSLKQVHLIAPERTAVDELRSCGIFQAPTVRNGILLGLEEIHFTHHLLHDYAIARSLIPETSELFCDFVTRESLLPIFYRQSFMFALEALWDADETRQSFWDAAFRLESAASLHSITRILAPILAARRVESLADLQPLLTVVSSAVDVASPEQKTLRHLASGLEDASTDSIRVGLAAWCGFAEQLGGFLPRQAIVEASLVHIIARLNEVCPVDPVQRLALNKAGRGLLSHHVAKQVSKGWRYAGRVAVEAVCRTFAIAPMESELELLSLLGTERLAQFPHDDLRDLADSLHHLGSDGEIVVLRLFEAAFSAEPAAGQWEPFGSVIMPMSIQKSDQWRSIRHELAGYYESRASENAGLMTAIACIAWNAVVRRHAATTNIRDRVLGTFQFRGVSCELVEDYSHMWVRGYETDENRILSQFEKLLREWAVAGDVGRLNAVLDTVAARNHTSLVWMVLMEVGAENPSSLGLLLDDVLTESVFLTHPDYAYGGVALLGALHRIAGKLQREKLENLILDLPEHAHLREDEVRDPVPSWIESAQNRLLGVLEESNIVLGPLRDLRLGRQAVEPLPRNARPEGLKITRRDATSDPWIQHEDKALKEPAKNKLIRLREAFRPYLDGKQNAFDLGEVGRLWTVILKCEQALKRHSRREPKIGNELWGSLVGACEKIAIHAAWPKRSNRWKTIRRLLLRASNDPMPHSEKDENNVNDDTILSWGWPSPRIDAARGLPYVAFRLGQLDKQIAAALRKLSRDKSKPVRFNLANSLAILEPVSADLMWELIDTMVSNETSFSVLNSLVSLIQLHWGKAPEKVRPRLRLILSSASQTARSESPIYETLAHAYLFHFLRTGDSECGQFISGLMAECDSERASKSLGTLLHICREGGWLTVGDSEQIDARADAVRARTWSFFTRLLTAAQEKLKQHRESLSMLQDDGVTDTTEAAKVVTEKLGRAWHLVHGVAMQLYFASGAFDEKRAKNEGPLTLAQTRRFWRESSALFVALAAEPHPQVAYQVVETLYHLMPSAPRDAFLLAAQSIRASATAGYQNDSLAVGGVVRLIQRALADYRELFRRDGSKESECLEALLQVLDLFVEAGWPEARQLTHRLEEIYR